MNAEKFGTFIAKCRKEKGMTQLELAEKLMVTDKAVSRWERGKGFPDIGLLLPLADALDLSLTELMCSERKSKEEHYPQDDTALAAFALLQFGEKELHHSSWNPESVFVPFS